MLSKEELIHKTQFMVRAFDTAFDQNIGPVGIIQMMHEASLEQTIKHKISALELVDDKKGWVLLNQNVEFFKPVQMGQKLNVITYPSGIEKIFTYRDYIVTDVKDNLIARSCSRFIMFDLVDRKMIKIPEPILEKMGNAASFHNIPRAVPFKISNENIYREDEYKVRYDELDFNFHLSTQYYFRWVLNTFPLEFLKSHYLKSIDLSMKSECHYGNIIRSHIFQKSLLEFDHVLKNGDVASATARTIWEAH